MKQQEIATSLESERIREVIGAEAGGDHVGKEVEGVAMEAALDVASDEGVIEDGGLHPPGNFVE